MKSSSELMSALRRSSEVANVAFRVVSGWSASGTSLARRCCHEVGWKRRSLLSAIAKRWLLNISLRTGGVTIRLQSDNAPGSIVGKQLPYA